MPVLELLTGANAYGLNSGIPYLLPTSYYSLATASITATSASITFTSITSGFTHLQIRGVARGTYPGNVNGSESIFMNMQFNSDSSAIYSHHRAFGTGADYQTYGVGSTNYIIGAYLPSANMSFSSFNTFVIDIFDYKNTSKPTVVRIINGFDRNSTSACMSMINSGAWHSTAAVDTIKIYPEASNFYSGSHFALYGIKGE